MLLMLLLMLSGNAQTLQKQVLSLPASFKVSDEEMRLYRMINDYRSRYDLPPIPLSLSLCYVASSHVKDLFFNHPDQEPCNFHSWSDKGPWKAFCYPKDENKKNSVWDKPREFTPYKGKAFEIVYWENNQVDIDSVMNFWKTENFFNSFLLNTGKWQGTKWEAIGVGIYENYACAWFGQIPDTYVAAAAPPVIKVKNETPDSGKSSKPAKAEVRGGKPAPAVPPPPVVAAQPDTNQKAATFFIIIRSNVPVKDTAKLLKLYRDKGFSPVKFHPNEGKGRISVFESADRAQAQAKLKEIKQQYRDAWLWKN